MTHLTTGTRVRLIHDVDRYPHFIAPEGATGTVVDIGDPMVFAVKLDVHIDGAEDWDNEIHWSNDDLEGSSIDAALTAIEHEPFPGYDANVAAGLPPDGDLGDDG